MTCRLNTLLKTKKTKDKTREKQAKDTTNQRSNNKVHIQFRKDAAKATSTQLEGRGRGSGWQQKFLQMLFESRIGGH